MNHYTLTVPDNPESLRKAAEFFAGLCNCLVEPRPISHEYSDRFKLMTPNEIRAAEDDRTGEENLTPQNAEMKPLTFATLTKAPWMQGGLHIPSEPLPPVILAEGEPCDASAIFSGIPAGTGSYVPPPPAPAVEVIQSGGCAPPIIAAATVELADGIPWDERIHSGSKNKLKGAPHGWKLKKQPAEYATKEEWLAYVAQVEAELRNAIRPVAPPAMPPPTFTDSPNIPSIKPNSTETPAMPPTPPIPPAPPTGPLTYAALTEKIVQAGIQPPQVQAALEGIGLSDYPTLMKSPELIPRFTQLLGLN